jgi:hypothetical protein
MSHLRALLLILVAAFLPLVNGCASDLRPYRDGKGDLGGVEGVIVDATGRGVRNTTITVLSGDPLPQQLGVATTDNSGRFTVEKLPAGNERVVRAERMGTAARLSAIRRHVSIVGGKIRDLGEIELKAGGE